MNCEEAQMLLIEEKEEVSNIDRKSLDNHLTDCKDCQEIKETLQNMQEYHDGKRMHQKLKQKIFN